MTDETPDQPALRVTFERGISPSKWAKRWAEQHPTQPAQFSVRMVRRGDPLAGDRADVLLGRLDGVTPASSLSAAPVHAIRLYEETVAVVVPSDHRLAKREQVSSAALEHLTLLPHPEHAPTWPSPEPWADPEHAPTTTVGTLEVVLAGVGAALVSGPLARHLSEKGLTAVPVTGLPGTEIWAAWLVENDSEIVQDFVGVLRGRGARSSRHASEDAPLSAMEKAKLAAKERRAAKAKAQPKSAGAAGAKGGRGSASRPGSGRGGRGATAAKRGRRT